MSSDVIWSWNVFLHIWTIKQGSFWGFENRFMPTDFASWSGMWPHSPQYTNWLFVCLFICLFFEHVPPVAACSRCPPWALARGSPVLSESESGRAVGNGKVRSWVRVPDIASGSSFPSLGRGGAGGPQTAPTPKHPPQPPNHGPCRLAWLSYWGLVTS